jgi:hypothetical protein
MIHKQAHYGYFDCQRGGVLFYQHNVNKVTIVLLDTHHLIHPQVLKTSIV